MEKLRKGWLAGLAGCVALTAGFAAGTSWSDELGADEAAIRAADAARLTAVRSGGFDDLPPAIGAQMRLSGSSLDWQPTHLDVARSGDLAYETASYRMGFRSPGGAPMTDRGTLLRVWKKQDGAWGVVAEAWTSGPPVPDGVATAPHLATPVTAPPAVAAPAPAAAPDVTAPPAVAAPPAVPGGDYGEPPVQYRQAIDQYFQRMLKHPESIKYAELSPPEKGSATVQKGLMSRNLRELGWTVRATIDATTADGRYVGFKTYVFLFRGEKIVSAKAPTPEGEMNF